MAVQEDEKADDQRLLLTITERQVFSNIVTDSSNCFDWVRAKDNRKLSIAPLSTNESLSGRTLLKLIP